MNNLKRIFTDTIKRGDLLSSQAGLRYKGQPQYESFCPGVLSILLVTLFFTVFVIKFISVLELKQIDAFQHRSDNAESAQQIKDFYFAIGIQNVDDSDFLDYFNIEISAVKQKRDNTNTIIQTDTTIPWRKCMMNDWNDKGISYMDQIWVKNGMKSLYCPDYQFSIQGTSGQDIYQYLQIKLTACQSTLPSCKNSSERQTYMSNFIDQNDYFNVKLYVLDTIISPKSQPAVSKILETDILLTFSQQTGSYGYIKIGDFQVQTDINVLPWQLLQYQTGYYIERFQTTTVPTANDQYLYLKIQKSTRKTTVERQYGKFDEMLSYVGGLFGILFVSVQFFSMSYNEYRYQLAVGQVLFNYDEDGDQVKQKDMTFCRYFLYSIYDWLAFFGCQPKSEFWNNYKKIHETRQQATQQIDICYLMRKIRYLQNVAQTLINADQRICLLLTQLPTLNKLQRIRKISEFYEQNLHGKHDKTADESINKQQVLLDKQLSKRMISLSNNELQNSKQSFHRIKSGSSNQMIGDDPTKGYVDMIQSSEMQLSILFDDSSQQKNIAAQISQALIRVAQINSDPLNNKIYKKLSKQIRKKIDKTNKQRINSSDSVQIIDNLILDEVKIFPSKKRSKKYKRKQTQTKN